MALSLKKQPVKKSSVKTGSGAAKKITKKRSWKKLGFLSMVAVLFISTVGYTGLSYWTAHELKAKASGYTYLISAYGVTAYGCKTYNSAYGGIYNLKVLWTKASSTPAYIYQLEGYRNNQAYYRQSGNSYWGNTVASLSTNYSIPLRDYAKVNIYKDAYHWTSAALNYPNSSGGITNPWSIITNC